ncbi:MAG: hypothetical protein KatS3mg102_1025 [Planctomycetota bacterium]|nr:MAG: hypothetical protein KatS3mg102_1025 [Planctomycetota bacterium]
MSATTEMRGEHREEGHGSGGWRGAPGRHGGRSARGAEEHRRPPGAGQAGPVEWPGRGAGTSLALDTPPGGTAWTAGRDAEERRSPRRRTLAAVRVLEGPALGGQAAATDLSGDGAFIRTEAAVLAGTRLGLELVLPTDPKPIRLGARVVRTSATGIGVRFEDLSARDRSRLRSYAGFYEMDEAIVRVQRALGDLVPGNLLPLAEPEEIQAVVRTAAERRLEVHVIEPGRGFKPARAWIAELLAVPVAGRELPAMRLGGLRRPLGPATGAVYLVFADPPLHYAFEALVPEPGLRPVLLVPERIYLTERRTSRRAQAEGAWCELEAPWRPGGRLRLSVLDLSERGASVRLHGEVALLPGMRLPPFWLHTAEGQRRVAGATVRYVTGSSSGALRAGLHFELEETAAQAGAAAGGDPQGAAGQRQSAPAVVRRPARTGLGPGLWRALRGLGTRLWGRWAARAGSPSAPEVEVVRYRNRLGRTVAAIVDANFETGGDGSPADVAIVIAPAFLKRKEVFGLLARTLIDDLGAEGRRVVVLRFDACHVVGESTADAEQVARGQPYFNWTFSDMAADIEASLHYLERRFRPRARVLVSCSLSSISARYALRSAELPPVDLWVAPYGCPDAQDMLRNYLAGLDLFEVYRRGERAAPLLIHGRPMNPDRLYGQTMQDGLAFLEEARRDVARLAMPIVWILGQYDYWVTASRVREMLAAPGGGVREVFELPTGHVLKSGPEAIEVFKLVSESVAKHIFGQDRPARDPDLARFQRQSEAEWARVQRLELADAAGFWHDHLFGEHEGDLGYDVLLDHPDYREFLARHVELLDPQPGEALADFGCGTGNLALALAEAYEQGRAPASITFVDLVPEAVARTEQKLRAHYARRGGAVPELRGGGGGSRGLAPGPGGGLPGGAVARRRGAGRASRGLRRAHRAQARRALRQGAARDTARPAEHRGAAPAAVPEPGAGGGGGGAGAGARRAVRGRRAAAGRPQAGRSLAAGEHRRATAGAAAVQGRDAAAGAAVRGAQLRSPGLLAGDLVSVRPAGGAARDAPGAQARRHAGALLAAAQLRPLQAVPRRGGVAAAPGAGGGGRGRRRRGGAQAGGAAALRQHGRQADRAGRRRAVRVLRRPGAGRAGARGGLLGGACLRGVRLAAGGGDHPRPPLRRRSPAPGGRGAAGRGRGGTRGRGM